MNTNFKTAFIAIMALLLPLFAQARISGSYYGTNYTAPFAHAYRALAARGIDHHEAIDRDVYHMARLGLNAFRLHLWDVELTDSAGTLLDNEHLELLDYLISRLESRGIAIILTAQTNFGNGYPERNTDPNGAYSYRFNKCEVHSNAEAIAAQQRYVGMLAEHRNRYTGSRYADDSSIIAIEINNEPCHSGTREQITAYIDTMVTTLRSHGWTRDILYNVSHNDWATEAYYRADIDGTTYQWYPTGLVSGHTRHANFLPYIDDYHIPFDTIAGYHGRSRVVYEYDPADVIDTYLYPAAARTFRKAGFDWITQFAYDPIDIAAQNTEYQTHFLNLAYTPGKAIGMMIAAEVVRQVAPGTDFGKYPADTVFADFTVSARRNLALLNDGEHYYHTNNVADAPKAPKKLRHIAGVGSSPLVTTDGTGAYFLDRLDADTWRLEIMPDVVLTRDPFGKPSPQRRVGEILYSSVALRLNLTSLSGQCQYKGIIDGTGSGMSETDGTMTLTPGVYLIGRNLERYSNDYVYNAQGCRVGEYVAPRRTEVPLSVVHTPVERVAAGTPLTIEATVVSDAAIDSVMVYPSTISFWNDHNTLYRMHKCGKYTYKATIDNLRLSKNIGWFCYNIVVFAGGKAYTCPGNVSGTPLDWDYVGGDVNRYRTVVSEASDAIILLEPTPDMGGSELATIPEAWKGVRIAYTKRTPIASDFIRISKEAGTDIRMLCLSKYIAPTMKCHTDIGHGRRLKVLLGHCHGVDSVKVGLVNADGFTYTAVLDVDADGRATVDIAAMTLDATLLNPAPYPTFLRREFIPNTATATALRLDEALTLTLTAYVGLAEAEVELKGIYIE